MLAVELFWYGTNPKFQQIELYAVSSAEANLNGSVNRPIQADNSISSVLGRLSVSRSPGSVNNYHFTCTNPYIHLLL